jgi:hypothetical protein
MALSYLPCAIRNAVHTRRSGWLTGYGLTVSSVPDRDAAVGLLERLRWVLLDRLAGRRQTGRS